MISQVEMIPIGLTDATECDDTTPNQISYHQGMMAMEILLETAESYDLSLWDILKSSRSQPCVEARQVAIYVMRTELMLNLREIGLLLGNRHHTTMLHAEKVINDLISVDAKLRKRVESIVRELPKPL